MRGSKLGVILMVMLCWSAVATGATSADSTPGKHLTYEDMLKMSSADMLRRTDATADEDYDAGRVALDRMEVVEAQGLFERAARKGHTGAMVKYADIIYSSGYVDQARAAYRDAAELGNGEGAYKLGSMYLDLGNYDWNDLDSKARPAEARKWIQKAADLGYRDAINALAQAYSEGGLGLTDADRTDEEVLKWLHKSADVGNGVAMDGLSQAYRKGKYGLTADKAMADEWAAKAKKAWGLVEVEKKAERKKRR